MRGARGADKADMLRGYPRLRTDGIRMICGFADGDAAFIDAFAVGGLFLFRRSPNGVASTAVAALKGGKVVGIVVTDGGSGYTDVSYVPYQ